MVRKKSDNPSSTPVLPLPLSKSTNSPVKIIGTLRNAAIGYPLGGLSVQVFLLGTTPAPTPVRPSKRRERQKLKAALAPGEAAQSQVLLGSANSTAEGLYQVTWIASPAVSQQLCLLANCPESQFLLKVSDGNSAKPLLVTQPMSLENNALVLNLAVPIAPLALTKRNWSDLGRRLQTAPIKKGRRQRPSQLQAASSMRLNDLVRELLLSPASKMLFKDWSLPLRQNAIGQLETAFLDPRGVLSKVTPVPSWQQLRAPNGLDSYKATLGSSLHRTASQQAFVELSAKVTQFSGVSAVDWVIDPKLFAKSPAAAITANQRNYFGPIPRTQPTPIDFYPELGYRDYLRTQWTNMITLAVYVLPHQLTVSQAEQQLRNRLHQDFRTQDTSNVAANEILIPILAEILTSAKGATFGFGVPLAQIPARGTATARQYLDTLIGLSGMSAQELTLRYRTNFTRADSVMSDAVWENIHTLQGFFRDSFQSVADPSNTTPDILNQPIIPSVMQGKAPFFLEYGEWLLLQQTIPFENYFQIREIFEISVSADTRTALQNLSGTSGQNQALYQLYVGALALQDQLVQAYQYVDQSEYKAALDALTTLQFPLLDLLNSPVVAQVDVVGGFATRHGMSVSSLDDLQKVLTLWQVGDIQDTQSPGAWDQWAQFYENALVCSLVYLGVFTIPVVSAQASLALGDYPTAVLELGRSAFFLVAKATISATTAYRNFGNDWSEFRLYHAGDLPYTADTEAKLPGYPSLADDDSVFWDIRLGQTPIETLANSLVPAGIHPVELLFFRLQMGGAMLEWADSLYRADDDSDISRARELYKGVYYLHGAVPPINPNWGGPGNGSFFGGNINPAQASQLARAELGFTQIDAGLNFFGYADDMVPILRYSTLKPAADTFATEAKSAEQDFLDSMAQLETATIENMKNAAMLQRANLQAQIAQQQAGIAQDQVQQAQILIAQVNQQIQAMEQQISDHDSFFGQVGDFFNGMSSIVKGLPSFFTSGVGSGVAAEAGFGSADTAGLLGLGAGASVLAGFGAFYVASTITLSSMASAQNTREGQLSNLQNQNLPSAQAQLDIAQRSATIASLQQQVAQNDAQLAFQLLAFAQERYLSIEFWSYMAVLFRRILRQYLDLATRMGWLAQRALSYEQSNDINIIQMDYFPAQEQGAGGADQLQLDLTGLEAQRLDGLREMIPVKYTASLARDFPLQFAQLLMTGQCVFQTQEQPLRWAYPGTYAYRVIAVTPTLSRIAATAPMRGLLSNGGISQISAGDGSMNLSVRPADALPISEFNLGTTDRQIYGLPGGTLMQFEGSGVETLWKLEFPAPANPSGLSDLLDVLITFDLRAQYASDLYQTQLQQMPTSINKFILVSAYKQQLSGLVDLQGNPNTATIAFDLTTIGLPAQEQNRKLNNIAVLVIGAKNAASIKASVISATPSKTLPVVLANGIAFSNAPPITDPQSTVALSPLNVMVGIAVNQTLSLKIDKSLNAGVDFSTTQDVLLGVDYTAGV
jgi:hypothetical protein